MTEGVRVPPIELVVDTGAQDTIVFSASAAARAIVRRPEIPSHEAAPAMHRHSGVTLRAGDWSTSLEIEVADGTHNARCPFDGRLGIDVLRACVIVISQSASSVRCAPG